MKLLSTFCLLLFSSVTSLCAQEDAGKICLEGNRLFIVVPKFGFSIYDVSQPTAPKEIRFVECPGILDIAVRGEYIYASRYQDLFLLKVPKDPTQPDEVVRSRQNVFPSRVPTTTVPQYTDVQFFRHFDAFQKDIEERGDDASPMPMVSVNGSMSCIALAGDYLYVVDGSSLRTYLAKPTDPNALESTNEQDLSGYNLETVWSTGNNRLYLGSQTGVLIYDISTRQKPALLGVYEHTFACDPVVVSGNFAYSTLRSGTKCKNTNNELVIIDISNPKSPVRANKVPMTNPHGLAVQGTTLTVCDGRNGFKVFDVSTPTSPRQVSHTTGLTTYDVLFDAIKRTAYISVPKELHIYSLEQPSNPLQQSVIVLPNFNRP